MGRAPSCAPPAVTITLQLERAPVIVVDAISDYEASRLRDWVSSQRDLADLLDQALKVREQRLRKAA